MTNSAELIRAYRNADQAADAAAEARIAARVATDTRTEAEATRDLLTALGIEPTT